MNTLNDTQLEILKLFSVQQTEQDLLEIKSLLRKYLADKVVREADKATSKIEDFETFELEENENVIIVKGNKKDCYDSYSINVLDNEDNWGNNSWGYPIERLSFFEYCKESYSYKHKPDCINWSFEVRKMTMVRCKETNVFSCPSFDYPNNEFKLVRKNGSQLIAKLTIEWGSISEEEKNEVINIIDYATEYKKYAIIPKKEEEIKEFEVEDIASRNQDIFIAFDGDIDAYNEFMGNH